MTLAIANDDPTNSIPRIVTNVDGLTFTCNAGGSANNGIYTPGANSLLLCVFTANGGTVNTTEPTSVTGHGVSYSKKHFQLTSNVGAVGLYVADAGASPTNAALNVTWTGTNASGMHVYDIEVTGANLSSGALGAIIQAVYTADSTITMTAAQVTLAASSGADNRPVACCAISLNTTITIDPSYVAVHQQGHTSEARTFETSWQSGGFDTVIDDSWTGNAAWGMLGFEISAAAAGGGTSVDPFGTSGFFGG